MTIRPVHHWCNAKAMGVDRETIVVYVPSFLWHDLRILDCGLGNGGVFKQRGFSCQGSEALA